MKIEGKGLGAQESAGIVSVELSTPPLVAVETLAAETPIRVFPEPFRTAVAAFPVIPEHVSALRWIKHNSLTA